MNQMTVNGSLRDLPISADRPFQELIEHLRTRYFNQEEALISSVRINGEEITGTQETLLGEIAIEKIGSIEIFTAHPREIAEETLQTLIAFSGSLASLSRNYAEAIEQNHFNWDISKLVDGISALTEAILGVRQVLHIGILPVIQVLEADLLSILKDMLQSQEKRESAYMMDLLREHLPKNLEQWRDEGIPTMIRSRDS